ncbi:M48 family metallopeptidase [Azospirillum sp. SYSU D00513]|uniref:M48 family metallopeptidase n=1 Tax=Azospirillum sp. SYSU D00513 TaxID=2812561 RepID=UPI001A974E63|nr:M48 family metallopeptidase [Azospirillum sp. SYSU D00513]
MDRRRMLGLLAGAATVPLLTGCGESGLPVNLVPEERVQAMGIETWQQLRSRTPASSNRNLQAGLQEVGRRLLVAAGENPNQWEMVVFASPELNAFALPGNKIGVYEGMFQAASTPDRLAAVVGHEIGHNQARHSQQRMNTDIAKQLGVNLAAAALQLGGVSFSQEIAALMGVGVEFGLALPYSRQQELEADRMGLFTMARAGFDPREAVTLWRTMDQLAGSRGPDFLATHPSPEARIAEIEALLPEVMAAARNG